MHERPRHLQSTQAKNAVSTPLFVHICPAVPHIFLTALLSYAAADFPHGHGETRLATENSQPVKNGRHGGPWDMRDTSAASRGKTAFCHTRCVMLAVCCPGHCSPSWLLIRVLRPTALRNASCVLTGRLRRASLRREAGAGLRNLTRRCCWHVAPFQYRC